jgi:hypothetical protein
MTVPGEHIHRLTERVRRRRAGLFPGEPSDNAEVTVKLVDLEALLGFEAAEPGPPQEPTWP